MDEMIIKNKIKLSFKEIYVSFTKVMIINLAFFL